MSHHKRVPETSGSAGLPAALAQVLITHTLPLRTARSPDHAAEAAALHALAAVIAQPAQTVIDTLLDLARSLCHADSAGLTVSDGPSLRIAGAGGRLRPLHGQLHPVGHGPCGYTLRSGRPELFAHPDRCFAPGAPLPAPLHELLMVPLPGAGAVLWVVSHSPGPRFDSEDVRLMRSLASFAAAALKGSALLESERTARHSAESGLAARRETEASLTRSEARFRTLLEILPVAVCVCDADGAIEIYNTAAAELWGRRPEACSVRFAGAHRLYRADGSPLPPEESPAARAIQTGHPIREDVVIEGEGGARRTVEMRVVPIKDARGRTAGAMSCFQDISERRAAEETLRRSREHLLLALGSARMAAWAWDAGLAESQTYGDFEEIYGIPGAEVVRRGYDLIHPDDRVHHRARIEALSRSGDGYHAEYRIVRPDCGAVVWLEEWAKAGPSGGPGRRVVAVLADITERKKAQERLARQARDLARSSADLESFAHIVAHDLKEPLRALRFNIGFLIEDCQAKLDAADRERLESLTLHAGRMHELLDALLAYSAAGSRDLRLSSVGLADVARDASEAVDHLLAEEGAIVEIDPGLPAVMADRALLAQFLGNLLINAVKYNRASPKHIRIGQENGAFYIRDNGIGIAPEHAGRIFEMFKRLHPRDQYGGGTGAGLAIAKRIIERLGGRIWLDSKPGHGSTFYFTLGRFPTAHS